MANSRRYQILKSRLNQLALSLLPKRYSPTGSYTQATLDKVRGFRLLAHAEFESYLEDIVTQYVDNAVVRWNQDKKLLHPLLCILASYEGADKINNFDKYPAKSPITLSTLINRCHVHFKHNVSSNHGIRTKNILPLLIQIGIDENALDSVWLGTVDAFGAERGAVAHNTGAVGYVSYQTDPYTTYVASQAICDGFKELDLKILALPK